MKPWWLLVPCMLGSGCGGTSGAAAQNRTFYDWTVAGPGGDAGEFEQRYPPLDDLGQNEGVAFEGYTVLRGGVHLSRPVNWRLQDAGNQPGNAFVQYISQNAYSFAVYERPEFSGTRWGDVMRRFEDDVTASGAKIVGKRVPIGSFKGQGRSYTVEREVEAPKAPFESFSREILMRGEHRIVLVQIVFQGENLEPIDTELLRVIRTLEVL